MCRGRAERLDLKQIIEQSCFEMSIGLKDSTVAQKKQRMESFAMMPLENDCKRVLLWYTDVTNLY